MTPHNLLLEIMAGSISVCTQCANTCSIPRRACIISQKLNGTYYNGIQKLHRSPNISAWNNGVVNTIQYSVAYSDFLKLLQGKASIRLHPERTQIKVGSIWNASFLLKKKIVVMLIFGSIFTIKNTHFALFAHRPNWNCPSFYKVSCYLYITSSSVPRKSSQSSRAASHPMKHSVM